jgi:tetratricopeptide (TPR) repeat protein
MARRLAILTIATWLAAGPAVRAADTVTRRSDPTHPLTGTIVSESPRGVRIKVGANAHEIPAEDVLRVRHDIASGPLRREFYTPAFTADERIATAADPKKAVAEALVSFEKLLAKLSPREEARVRRNVEFQVASLTARQALEQGKSPDAAVGRLRQFCKKYPDGWQIIPAAKLLGRLLTAERHYAEAEKAYQELADNAALPDEARNTLRLLAARVAVRPGNYAEAESKLNALLQKLPKGSRQALQARVCHAECLTAQAKFAEARDELKAVLNEAKGDKELRARAYNALGRCSYDAKQYKEALWDFLRVDVVYYQDPEEHAKALYHLADLFTKLKDPGRARESRERLLGKEFSGTEYQARLLKEQK